MSMENYWNKFATEEYVGRKIIAARYMDKEEAESLGWSKRPVVFELDDGSLMYPSMDDEGNDGGALFGQGPKGNNKDCPLLRA